MQTVFLVSFIIGALCLCSVGSLAQTTSGTLTITPDTLATDEQLFITALVRNTGSVIANARYTMLWPAGFSMSYAYSQFVNNTGLGQCNLTTTSLRCNFSSFAARSSFELKVNFTVTALPANSFTATFSGTGLANQLSQTIETASTTTTGSTTTGGTTTGSTTTGGDGSTTTGGDGSSTTGGDGSSTTGGDGSSTTGGDGDGDSGANLVEGFVFAVTKYLF
eukprot:TRINITY_DN1384_c0_g4_i1.p1 TRINITY_DN1384_c0_g4~~TRINITY_DN1384_c0_g4_i1.p1  ORF type:complete len:221 (+),score=33.09 TRINITY_DN1384_c0_g4_i1:126-788(+)